MTRMSRIRDASSLPMGKGCVMTFKVDNSQPEDSKDHHWSEVTYDGEPDSWCPVIGSHYHKLHDEYMQVFEGQVEFVLDNVKHTLTADCDPLHIPKLHVHSFSFVKGVRTRLTERTHPASDLKEKFFQRLFATPDGQPSFFSLAKSINGGDMYLSLPGGLRSVDEGVTWFMGVLGRL